MNVHTSRLRNFSTDNRPRQPRAQNSEPALQEVLGESALESNRHLKALTSSREKVLAAATNEKRFALQNLDHNKAARFGKLSLALSECDGDTLMEMLDVANKASDSKSVSGMFNELGSKLSLSPMNRDDVKTINRLEWSNRLGVATAVGCGLATVVGAAALVGDPGIGLLLGLNPALGVGWGIYGLWGAIDTRLARNFSDKLIDRGNCITQAEAELTKILHSPSNPTNARGHKHSKTSLLEQATRELASCTTSDQVRFAQQTLSELESLPGENAAEMFTNAFNTKNKAAMETLVAICK